jgi:hypothetical protein
MSEQETSKPAPLDVGSTSHATPRGFEVGNSSGKTTWQLPTLGMSTALQRSRLIRARYENRTPGRRPRLGQFRREPHYTTSRARKARRASRDRRGF